MRPRAVALLAVLLLPLVGCGDTSSDDERSVAGADVSMTEFAFDPSPITVPGGDHAVLEVVNDGAVAHNLLIGELGKGTPNLGPGESFELDLSGQPPGTYRVICDLPGHVEAGMVTEITIS